MAWKVGYLRDVGLIITKIGGGISFESGRAALIELKVGGAIGRRRVGNSRVAPRPTFIITPEQQGVPNARPIVFLHRQAHRLGACYANFIGGKLG